MVDRKHVIAAASHRILFSKIWVRLQSCQSYLSTTAPLNIIWEEQLVLMIFLKTSIQSIVSFLKLGLFLSKLTQVNSSPIIKLFDYIKFVSKNLYSFKFSTLLILHIGWKVWTSVVRLKYGSGTKKNYKSYINFILLAVQHCDPLLSLYYKTLCYILVERSKLLLSG